MENLISDNELNGTLKFIGSMTTERLARFIINQNRAIDGLTENNRDFSKSYVELLKSKGKCKICNGSANFRTLCTNPDCINYAT